MAAASEEDEQLPEKKIRKTRVAVHFEVVMRWVTGERAPQPEEDLEPGPFLGSTQIHEPRRTGKTSLAQRSGH